MKEHVINHPSELNSISALPIKRTVGLGRIRLGESAAKHPERETWERELNRGHFACGCDAAAKGLLIGLVAGIVWSWSTFANGDASLWPLIFKIVGIAIAGAMVGKAVGLFAAEARLRKVVQSIQEQWKVDSPPQEALIMCG
jgi:hypothetical protein